MPTEDNLLIEDISWTDCEVPEVPEGIDPVLWVKWVDPATRKKDEFLERLHRGLDGQNIGLSTGLKGFDKYMHGIHKARYYLLGAESAVGKTTMADFIFVFKAWESAKAQGRPIKIFYFSFEIGRIEKKFRWCSYYIYMKHGISLPADYLQGQIEGKLVTKEHLAMVLEAYGKITELMKDVSITDDVLHPTKIFETMIDEHFAKHGTVLRKPVPPEELRKNPRKKGYVTGYIENDPRLITIMIIDHLALTNPEMGLDTKGTMDKTSHYCIALRNLFFCTCVVIQQFSTDMMSTYRGAYGKKTEEVLSPQRLDFGDSKATFRDACVVLGGVKPQKDMDTFDGYDLSVEDGLGDCFVAWYLMKNRYGTSNRMIPLFMDAVAGVPFDLPEDGRNVFAMQPWVEKAQKIEDICQQYSPKVA